MINAVHSIHAAVAEVEGNQRPMSKLSFACLADGIQAWHPQGFKLNWVTPVHRKLLKNCLFYFLQIRFWERSIFTAPHNSGLSHETVPKTNSRASLTANVGALCIVSNFKYLTSTSDIDTSLFTPMLSLVVVAIVGTGMDASEGSD